MSFRFLKRLWPFIVIVGVCAIVYYVLEKYSVNKIWREIKSLDGNTLLSLTVLTIVNFFILGVVEAVALQRERFKVPLHRAFLSGFISNAFSYTLGAPLITGSAIRARLYLAWGLAEKKVLDLIIVIGFHYWGAMILLLPLFTLIVAMTHLVKSISLPEAMMVFLVAVIAVAVYLIFIRKRRVFRLKSLKFVTPPRSIIMVLLVLSVVDALLHSFIYFFSIPNHTSPYSLVGFTFFASQVAGFISNIPAGLGVFESVGFVILKDSIKHESLIAGMLVYRFFMYVSPFLLACVLFALIEIKELSKNPKAD